jgi:xanthine/uracil permease
MLDEEKAAKQSQMLANIMFAGVVLVLFACAMFGTWTWLGSSELVPWPPIVMGGLSIVLWIVLIAVIVRGWRGIQRRKELENR